ncbi:hypothetical protein BN128_2419 [Cronobacter sakazakii 696]|nr:hypothetical protein BN128_2419 [Cronobacter sakazakii 696]
MLGFRYQQYGQHDEEQVETGVDPEGRRVAQRVEHSEEGRTDNHVRNPVGRGGERDAEIAAFQRLNFRAQHPDQRAGAHGETDDKHQQHRDGEVLACRAVDAHVQHGAENAHTGGHDDKAQNQRRLTAPAVNQTDGDKGRQDVGQADNHGAPHLLCGVGVTRQFKDFRRVIHDDVHPGELLHHLQQNAEEDRAAEIAVVFKQRPAALFHLQAFTNLFQLAFGFGAGVTQAQQDALGVVEAAFGGEPARAVRQEENANQQQDGRDSDNTQHPAPGAAVAERGVREIRAQNPDGDHQLIHRNHTAADFLRRNFREVQRRGVRGDTDREAQQHAGDNQHFHIRRERRAEGADNEQHGANHQAVFTPETRREPAAADRANRGAEHHGADHPLLLVGCDIKIFGDKGQCARNDADIEAEKKSCQGRQKADEERHGLV